MKRAGLAILLTFCTFAPTLAQKADRFCGSFHNKENNISLHLNLKEEAINIPGFEMLGPTNGYMNGNIYGTWIVTKYKVADKAATIRLTNDFGSETQEIKLTHLAADTFALEMLGSQVIRKVEKRKLVKIPSKYIFIKSKK